MFQICRHVKTNGNRCLTPAVAGSPFCHFHAKIHAVGAEPHLKYGPLQLPAPEDGASIQLSIARINDAIINDRIDLKKARAILYGIQIAARFIDRKKPVKEEKTVSSVELTVHGDELAPGNYICDEKVDDCPQCPFSTKDQCTRWEWSETGTQDPPEPAPENTAPDANAKQQPHDNDQKDDGKKIDDGKKEDDGNQGDNGNGADDSSNGGIEVAPASLPAVAWASPPAPSTPAPALETPEAPGGPATAPPAVVPAYASCESV